MSSDGSEITFDEDVATVIDEYVRCWENGLFEGEPTDYYETWKIDYSEFLQENLVKQYDLTDISPQEIDSIVDILNERISISKYIPAYMIGGQSGGEAWRGFKKISRNNPDATAEVLSEFFDTSGDLTDRLELFKDHYGAIMDEYSVSGGPLMTLATCLLMFTHPDEYIQYKYGMMKDFFHSVSDYRIGTGFDTQQYTEINAACLTLLNRLRSDVENPSMLHIHNLILYWEDLLEGTTETEHKSEETDAGATASDEDTDSPGETSSYVRADAISVDLSGIDPPEGLYFEDWDRIRNQIQTTLNTGKNIIFTGPPGTGKTELAEWVCEIAVSKEMVDGYTFATATADWTAFDTIGGYTPTTDNAGQELEFEPRLFLSCFRDETTVVNKWLLIDEINRADIDKAFGPLFSVLSGNSVELPYEDEETGEQVTLTWIEENAGADSLQVSPHDFPVTPAWRLVATMNTQDKASLYEMSYAFMRRFNFIHIGVPNLETSSDKLVILDSFTAHDVWNIDVEEQTLRSTEALWRLVNDHQAIGPAIVKDILEYVENYPARDDNRQIALVDAVISLIFPQMEGLRPDDQKRLARSMADLFGAEGETLENKAEDFFGIDITDE